MSPLKSFLAVLIAMLFCVTFTSNTAFANEESEVHYKKGDEYYKANQYSDALMEYQKAMEIDPNVYKYPNDAGWSLYFMEKYDEAEEYFNQALKLHKDYPNSIRGLALIHQKQGKLDQAKDEFN